MANRTPESIKMFADLANIWMKIVITGVILGLYATAIITLIVKIAQNSSWENNVILGAVDVMLTYSVPIIIRHFFPNKTNE